MNKIGLTIVLIVLVCLSQICENKVNAKAKPKHKKMRVKQSMNLTTEIINNLKISESKMLTNANSGRKSLELLPISVRKDLESIAQKEADRLSAANQLMPPLVRLKTNYFGYNFKYTFDGSKVKEVSKLCFTNMIDNFQEKIVDENAECFSSLLADKSIRSVGFGFGHTAPSTYFVVRYFIK